ncbi:recombinase family protein [Actinokineospora sp. 24-640]
MRFALFGRASTVGFQDPVTTRAWQWDVASRLIEGHGRIVAEFFDVGVSRQVPWMQRPAGAALLAAAVSSDREFDAVVVGEFERAFDAGQLDAVLTVLDEAGVQLWLPEAEGPVERGSVWHEALVKVLGAQSRREVLRARHRAMTAMRRQVVEQGRYLGGRPPYGYRLVDAGPHPNRRHAGWGRRLQRLEPDPATAETVRWIFAERIAGKSAAGIARGLNERGVACPSAVDRDRNRHRSGARWTLRSVIEILENPRYTGRQVWSRTAADRGQRSASGRRPSVRRPVGEWAVSERLAHEPLVAEVDFVAAQAAQVVRVDQCGRTRRYRLSGLVRCGLCGRRMDSHWVHRRPGYRCRHGRTSAHTPSPDVPKPLYVREDHLLETIAVRLAHHGDGVQEAGVEGYLRSTGMVIRHSVNGTIIEPKRAETTSPTERT